jgi:hypothetical protein
MGKIAEQVHAKSEVFARLTVHRPAFLLHRSDYA